MSTEYKLIKHDNRMPFMFGGVIIDMDLSMGSSSSPATLNLTIVSESGEYDISENILELKTPLGPSSDIAVPFVSSGSFDISGANFFMCPMAYKVKSNEGGEVLSVQFVDQSIYYLDNQLVLIEGKQAEEKGLVNQGSVMKSWYEVHSNTRTQGNDHAIVIGAPYYSIPYVYSPNAGAGSAHTAYNLYGDSVSGLANIMKYDRLTHQSSKVNVFISRASLLRWREVLLHKKSYLSSYINDVISEAEFNSTRKARIATRENIQDIDEAITNMPDAEMEVPDEYLYQDKELWNAIGSRPPFVQEHFSSHTGNLRAVLSQICDAHNYSFYWDPSVLVTQTNSLNAIRFLDQTGQIPEMSPPANATTWTENHSLKENKAESQSFHISRKGFRNPIAEITYDNTSEIINRVESEIKSRYQTVKYGRTNYYVPVHGMCDAVQPYRSYYWDNAERHLKYPDAVDCFQFLLGDSAALSQYYQFKKLTEPGSVINTYGWSEATWGLPGISLEQSWDYLQNQATYLHGQEQTYVNPAKGDYTRVSYEGMIKSIAAQMKADDMSTGDWRLYYGKKSTSYVGGLWENDYSHVSSYGNYYARYSVKLMSKHEYEYFGDESAWSNFDRYLARKTWSGGNFEWYEHNTRLSETMLSGFTEFMSEEEAEEMRLGDFLAYTAPGSCTSCDYGHCPSGAGDLSPMGYMVKDGGVRVPYGAINTEGAYTTGSNNGIMRPIGEASKYSGIKEEDPYVLWLVHAGAEDFYGEVWAEAIRLYGRLPKYSIGTYPEVAMGEMVSQHSDTVQIDEKEPLLMNTDETIVPSTSLKKVTSHNLNFHSHSVDPKNRNHGLLRQSVNDGEFEYLTKLFKEKAFAVESSKRTYSFGLDGEFFDLSQKSWLDHLDSLTMNVTSSGIAFSYTLSTRKRYIEPNYSMLIPDGDIVVNQAFGNNAARLAMGRARRDILGETNRTSWDHISGEAKIQKLKAIGVIPVNYASGVGGHRIYNKNRNKRINKI